MNLLRLDTRNGCRGKGHHVCASMGPWCGPAIWLPVHTSSVSYTTWGHMGPMTSFHNSGLGASRDMRLSDRIWEMPGKVSWLLSRSRCPLFQPARLSVWSFDYGSQIPPPKEHSSSFAGAVLLIRVGFSLSPRMPCQGSNVAAEQQARPY